MASSLPSPRLSPYLVVRDGAGLLGFMERAFGAKVLLRRHRPDGQVAHAEARVGGSVVMVGSSPDGKKFPAMLHLFVHDVDAAYRHAMEQGAKPVRAPQATGCGSRMAGVRDPYGNQWWFTAPARMGRQRRPRGHNGLAGG